jgi:hypothetical protein
MHAVKWSFWGILEEDFTSWLRTCLYGLMTLLLLRNYLEAASLHQQLSFQRALFVVSLLLRFSDRSGNVLRK